MARKAKRPTDWDGSTSVDEAAGAHVPDADADAEAKARADAEAKARADAEAKARRQRETADLVVRAKQGDDEAFIKLCEGHLNDIFKYASYKLPSIEDAEDITTETFLKAMKGLHNCEPDRFRSWLFGIARNLIADLYGDPERKLDRVDIELIGSLADVLPPFDFSEVVDDLIRPLLNHLTSEQRQVIELGLDGYTSEEIRLIMDKEKVTAVYMLRYRAVHKIQQLLAQPKGVDNDGTK